jgi:hypothetical protein
MSVGITALIIILNMTLSIMTLSIIILCNYATRYNITHHDENQRNVTLIVMTLSIIILWYYVTRQKALVVMTLSLK